MFEQMVYNLNNSANSASCSFGFCFLQYTYEIESQILILRLHLL